MYIHRSWRWGQGLHPRLSYYTISSVFMISRGGRDAFAKITHTNGSLMETTKTLPASLSLSLLT